MGEVDRVIRRARFELMLSRHLQSTAVALLLLCAFFWRLGFSGTNIKTNVTTAVLARRWIVIYYSLFAAAVPFLGIKK